MSTELNDGYRRTTFHDVIRDVVCCLATVRGKWRSLSLAQGLPTSQRQAPCGPVRGCRMIIVMHEAVLLKRYLDEYRDRAPEWKQGCPLCGLKLVKHGRFLRFVVFFLGRGHL